ncbi:carboxymuconolactone decarboxylase family protein [Dactylosporangium sp. CA-139066]|uniref:carboxymuconolactone decarboxylase family protein n=1 Tax=Dactylosporangium sp. CA-139066 TaxID=3239930 RepID=UPI003D92D94D
MEPRINLMTSEIGLKIGKRLANISTVLEQSSLPKGLQELVSLRCSQINGCAWCVDLHTKEGAAAGESAVRLHQVAVWRESAVFSDAERAALALAEEGTRLADAHHGVSDETWEQVGKHYDEEAAVALVCLVSLVNAANRLGVVLRQPGGGYEVGMFSGLTG